MGRILPFRSYDASFHESHRLADGTEVAFRALSRADGPILLRHFAALSPETRRRRFLSAKAMLTAADLRHLTALDGEMRFGLVAALANRTGDAIAVARFVRLPHAPHVAEPAVTVIDRMHGRGLGLAIVSRLVQAAVERGVRRFRWDMLANNAAVERLARALGGDVIVLERGAVARVAVLLPEAS